MNGKFIHVIAELYSGPARATVLRWLHGSDHQQLSDLETAAVQLELERLCSS